MIFTKIYEPFLGCFSSIRCVNAVRRIYENKSQPHVIESKEEYFPNYFIYAC